jgi:hypothetical protein
MHARFRSIVALLCVLAAVPLAAAADGQNTPTLVLRVRSIDGLLNDAKYLLTVAGKENEAAQIGGLVQSQVGKQGLFGIDTKRPLGFYAKLQVDVMSSPSVLLIPIVDQDTFLKQLELFNVQAKKDNDGIYGLTLPGLPVPAFFTFANKYLYFTALSKNALLPANLLNPNDVLPAEDKNLFSTIVNFDQVPDQMKQMFLMTFEQQLQTRLKQFEKEGKPDETEAQRKLRVQSAEVSARQLAAAIRDGRRLDMSFNVDQQAKQLTVDGRFAAKSGSTTAAGIAELGRSKSLFGALVKPDDAFSILAHFSLPEGIRAQFAAVVEEPARKEIAKQTDAAKRALGEQLINAIDPSLKAGEFDGLLQIQGPSADKKYDLLAVLKIQDSAKVDEALRSAVNAMPPAEKALVELNADKAGNVNIHRLNAQARYDEQTKAFFGDNPLYVAVTSHAVVVSGGPRGLALIKSAAALQPQEAPIFALSTSMSRLAPLMDAGNKGNGGTKTSYVSLAQKIFGKAGKDDDQVLITVRGGADLQGHLIIKAPVLRFAAEVGEARK